MIQALQGLGMEYPEVKFDPKAIQID